MNLRLINLFLLLALNAGAQTITNLIPADRLPVAGSYQGVAGVPGGIDQYSANYKMFCNVRTFIPGTTNIAYGDGVHDDTAALNFAINAATNGSFVYIPTGKYLISAPLSRTGSYAYDLVQKPFSIILRGDGPTNTMILNNGAGEGIVFKFNLGFGGHWRITDGAARGSTSITVPGSYKPAVNQWVIIDRANSIAGVYAPSSTDPHPFYYTYDGSADQMVKITSVNGNVYGISPPLNDGFGTNDFLLSSFSQPLRCGIEDLCIVQLREYNAHNIRIMGGQECWIRNVESRQARGYHVSLEFCGGCEVRQCYVHDPFPQKNGANGGGGSCYGIAVGFHSSSCLVEDNIALHCRHSFIMDTAAGQNNVIAYNFGKDNITESLFDTDYQEDADYHGGEQRYCLWEGNVVPIIAADTVEGSTKYVTYYRNLVTRDGLPKVTVAMFAMDIQRGHYYDYFLNNVYLRCLAAPSTMIYRLGSWQDTYPYDPTVITNNTWLGNFDFATGLVDRSSNGVINWQSAVPNAFPASFIYASKPAWYPTNLNWPPFGSDVPGKTNLIPAQVRAIAMGITTNQVIDYQLTATNSPGGTAKIPGNGKYFNGAIIVLNAKPDTNFAFTGWSGYPVANSNSLVTYLIMPATNISVKANFTSGASYALNVLNGTGGGTYVPGAIVSLSASVLPGQQFAGWTLDNAAIMADTNAATTTLLMPTTNLTVQANYTIIPATRQLLPPSNLRVQ